MAARQKLRVWISSYSYIQVAQLIPCRQDSPAPSPRVAINMGTPNGKPFFSSRPCNMPWSAKPSKTNSRKSICGFPVMKKLPLRPRHDDKPLKPVNPLTWRPRSHSKPAQLAASMGGIYPITMPFMPARSPSLAAISKYPYIILEIDEVSALEAT